MDIGKNILKLRNTLKMSQQNFGAVLNLAQASIALIENGKQNVTNRVITDICREFYVNKDWLLTGEGEMFNMDREELLSYLMGRLAADDDDFKKEFITEILEVILDMDQEACDNIKAMIRRLAKIIPEEGK